MMLNGYDGRSKTAEIGITTSGMRGATICGSPSISAGASDSSSVKLRRRRNVAMRRAEDEQQCSAKAGSRSSEIGVATTGFLDCKATNKMQRMRRSKKHTVSR